MVENHLKSMIVKHFDPKKADSIFTDEGEVFKQYRHDFYFSTTSLKVSQERFNCNVLSVRDPPAKAVTRVLATLANDIS